MNVTEAIKRLKAIDDMVWRQPSMFDDWNATTAAINMAIEALEVKIKYMCIIKETSCKYYRNGYCTDCVHDCTFCKEVDDEVNNEYRKCDY